MSPKVISGGDGIFGVLAPKVLRYAHCVKAAVIDTFMLGTGPVRSVVWLNLTDKTVHRQISKRFYSLMTG